MQNKYFYIWCCQHILLMILICFYVCILTGSSSPTVQKETGTSGAEPEASSQDELPPLCVRLLSPAGLRRADNLRKKHEDEHRVFCSLPWESTTQPQLDRKCVEEKERSLLCLWWNHRSSREQQQSKNWLNSTMTVTTLQGTVCMDPTDQAQGMSVLHLGEFMLKFNYTGIPTFFYWCGFCLMLKANQNMIILRKHLQKPADWKQITFSSLSCQAFV